MGAGAAHLKILTAMRHIDRLNCELNRELASMEHCPCELLEAGKGWSDNSSWSDKHYRLEQGFSNYGPWPQMGSQEIWLKESNIHVFVNLTK